MKGVIDWDFAEPGDPIGDVSQFAWYAVPLRGDDYWRKAGFSEEPDLRARLLTLSEAYGAEPKAILDALIDLQLEDSPQNRDAGQERHTPMGPLLRTRRSCGSFRRERLAEREL